MAPASTENERHLKEMQEELVNCSRRGDVAGAELLLGRIAATPGYQGCVEDFNAVIHTCTQAGNMTRVEEHLASMESRGPAPNMRTYNMVINAYATGGDVARTEKFVERMRLLGVQPNYVTYSTLCKVYARLGAVEKIEQVMTIVEQYVGPLNEYFFASLISACGQTTPPQLERAERALDDLVRRGLKAQSVKRALSRVVGEERTAHLLKMLGLKMMAQPQVRPGATATQLPLPPGLVAEASSARRRAPPAAVKVEVGKGAADAHDGSGSSTGPGTPRRGPSVSCSTSDGSGSEGQGQGPWAAKPRRAPGCGKGAGGKGASQGAARGAAKAAARGAAKGAARPQNLGKARAPAAAPPGLNAPAALAQQAAQCYQQAQPPKPQQQHPGLHQQQQQQQQQQQPVRPNFLAPPGLAGFQAAAPPPPRHGGSPYVPGSALLQAASLQDDTRFHRQPACMTF